MKVERIETFVLKAALGEERFFSSQARFADRASLIVRVTTDSGLVGYGEGGVSMPVAHLATFVHETIAPRLLGRDPLQTGPVWHELYGSFRDFGRAGACVDAISGIDIALWDIRGREAGRPIHALMGGAFRDRVRAYATGLYYHEDDLRDPVGAVSRVRDEAAAHVEAGLSAIKGKVGLLSLPDDIARMAAARETIGDECLFMSDANHAYNRHFAGRMGRALEELGCYWFEEPLVPEDVEGCAALRRELSVAIAAGECEYTAHGMLRLLAADAVDVLQPDICVCGGPTEAQRVLALASAFHAPVCPHVWGSGIAVAAALQFTAVIPPTPFTAAPHAPENEPMFELDRTPNPLRDELVSSGYRLEGDMMLIPQGPGLGIEIDEEALGRLAVDRRETTCDA
jgi:D-galactarolactone cycloisomerase